ncbi:YaiI/YqxD family protein [Aquibacillus sp. 3ASR75-11]|uniref:UPF0178 protein NC797_17175 n=1 Tax=Terrihalobacillus insolitus TaxID=2950438 RepID=A0A9X3WZN8_9BACI|nr:YaiI/YqxD family protein [Terrihalobacillus insolitus]MDC3415213.1 YaiI/YqxD family protein [Terrihalobacillus insolitus]MDC3426229.1 YaiI/YqxD family protein [Terrihalobacillus insolitus]
MNIYIDADACPVKEIVLEEAKKTNIPVTLVKSFSHFSPNEDTQGVTTIYVDTGADAADYRIMQLAKKGDIIITQDYGLASLALGKGCTVLHHKGFAYTKDNIDSLLTVRHYSAKARRGGHKTKGPKAMADIDREKFRELLVQKLS